MRNNTYITKQFILFITLLLISGGVCYGQNNELTIYFRQGSFTIDTLYKDNNKTLDRIVSSLNSDINIYISSIDINAYASPEGSAKFNQQLSEKRASAVKQYLADRISTITLEKIRERGMGVNWEGLRDMVSASTMIDREAVLTIIDNVSEKVINNTSRKKQLMDLKGGRVWFEMEELFFAELRKGASLVIRASEDAPQHIKEEIYNKLVGKDTTIEPIEDVVTQEPIEEIAEIIPIEIQPETPIEYYYKPLFSIKTNLLADALTSINIAVEIPISQRWSIEAEWMFPWWIFNNNRYYNQLLMGTLEGRYWFRTKRQTEVLTGHAVGAYVSAGYYDFQWKKRGYQGEIIPSVGVSYTYAHRVGKHFRMEYSVGVGMLYTKFKEYTANDNYTEFPWLRNGTTMWFGPTKAEVSFVWLINKKSRR